MYYLLTEVQVIIINGSEDKEGYDCNHYNV